MYNFVEILSDIAKAGQSFAIAGISSANAENFTVSLSSGNEVNSEAVLSIDVDFSSNKVILNKSTENEVELVRGEKFEFIIQIGNDSFKISLNGNTLNEFKWQMSPDKIRSVIVHGDVNNLLKVNHLDGEYPSIVDATFSDGENLAFESYIPIKYRAGHVISITGKCYDEFYLMFTKNDTNRQLIHFNPRFDERVVVMNTEDEAGWNESEQRSSEFPFEVEQPFKISFAFTEEHLKVAVNGSSLMDFSFENVNLEEENLYSALTGFRIMNRNEEAPTTITNVKHFHMDSSCNGFEQYSAL